MAYPGKVPTLQTITVTQGAYLVLMLGASLSASALIGWGWYLARKERRLLRELKAMMEGDGR